MARNNATAVTGGIRTVLMGRFSALGDVAMTVPVIYSACRNYPDIRFVMLTRPSMTSLFVGAPSNLTVVGADVSGKYDGIRGLRTLAAELYSEYRPDVFVDLHNVLRTRILSVFLRLKGVPSVHIFKPRAKRRALTRRVNKVMLPLTSQRARYREVFFKAGLPCNEIFDGLYHARNSAPTADYAAITVPKSEGEKWIGIAPFAAHAGKIYPPDKMERIVEMFQRDADRGERLHIFLFGGGGSEQATLEEWAAKYPCVQSLAGKKYGFYAELALLNHLDVMLAMDSANMHLAAIAGAPTLSIWGATHPYCGFKGWRQRDDDTIQVPVPCRPCSVFGDKACFRGDYICLTAIKPEVVYSRMREKLK